MTTTNFIISLMIALTLLPLSVRAELALPVANGVVTSGVGWRVDPFGSGRLVFHRGTDIAVPVGTPVRATHGGKVVFAGVHGGHGNTVIIRHDSGDRTLYGHNMSVDVQLGSRVEAGAVIAHSGNTGRSTGPHVHYEVIANSRRNGYEKQEEYAAESKYGSAGNSRNKGEQRIDGIVGSILTKINEIIVPSGNSGQGG